MRVVHLDSGREMRGGQRQVLYLLEGLASSGHQLTLLALPGAPLFETAARRGFDVRPLLAASAVRLSRAADLVHAHDAHTHALAAFGVHRPIVVARRVAFPVRGGPLSRWKYSRAAHYIAVSGFVKNTLAEAGVPAEKISVVYDGVPIPVEPASGSGVLAPETEDPRKGSDLARAAAKLGGFGVRFSNDLPEDLAGAAIFLYLTRQEGLGSAVLLAMASGLPVVASRVGGLPEAVRHEETGLLVDNSAEAVAAAVTRLLGNRELARRMGHNGRRLAIERFSAAAMVSGTLQVYDRVLTC